jgi:hypothetical protein
MAFYETGSLPYTLVRDDEEFDLIVNYTISPGRPATGPTYSCGGEPAEPDEADILSITLDGAPFTLTEEEDLDLYDFILDHHDWGFGGPDPDEAYNRMREEEDRTALSSGRDD